MRTTAMNRYAWLIVASIVLSLGPAVGEAGVIFPVTPSTGFPDQTRPVTVSLFDVSGRDVTSEWLPTWSPNGTATVYVAFNALGAAATPSSITLKQLVGTPVFNGSNPFLTTPPTTSAYLGRCTNFGSETTPDYSFPGTQVTIPNTQRMGYALTSEDCGGMAVIEAAFTSPSGAAGTYLFVIPQDSNRNGMPDVWEARFCPNGCLATDDGDAGPVTPSPIGDGIAAFDEYRGFIVSGQHVSTDPRQRDLFVHLVNPQCGTPSLLGGGTPPSPTYPTDGSGLFDRLATLVPGSQVHLLGHAPGQANTTTTEWVDRFQSFSQQTGFRYLDPITNATISVAPVDDRRINKNSVFPLGIANPIAANGLIHKGLRVTECLDVSTTGPLGTTGIGGPNGPDNSLLYTLRIKNYITTLISNGGTRALKVFAFENGAWVEKKKPNNEPTDADFVTSHAIKFYVAHELTHSTQLTPTVEGTSRTSYGYHHAPGTGSVMDQTIVQKIDKSTSGFNSFYIPSTYNGSDQSNYKAK
jgi:hypothetical protein